MRYGFDTDTFSLLIAGHERVSARYAELVLEDTHSFKIPAVVWIEALTGRFASVIKASNREELVRGFDALVRTEKALAEYERLAINYGTAKLFEKFKADRKLKATPQKDLQIACICLAHDATLVTRNVKDFKLVPGLKVENWAD